MLLCYMLFILGLYLYLKEVETLKELENFPSNRFEKLLGDRKNQFSISISINVQWRICFKWDEEPYDVEIVDYH